MKGGSLFPAVKFLPHQFYHLYNRGVNKGQIFLEAENYRFFLRRLSEYLDKACAQIIAYCLMPNHYHAVIRLANSLDFSNTLRGFTSSYVKSFNAWHHRFGYLFQGNTQSRLIEGDDDLVQLCRYVHLNPVTAGFVPLPELWEYSDYRDWIAEPTVENSSIRSLREIYFGSGEQYRLFVMDYAAEAKMRKQIELKLFGSTKQKSVFSL